MRRAPLYTNRAAPTPAPGGGGGEEALPNGTVRGTRSAGTGQQAGASRRRALIGPRRGHLLLAGALPARGPPAPPSPAQPGGAEPSSAAGLARLAQSLAQLLASGKRPCSAPGAAGGAEGSEEAIRRLLSAPF